MKKIVALLLAFMFCFGCVFVFQAFDGGQLEAEAADSIPPILFYLSGQAEGKEAVVDFDLKTVTFVINVDIKAKAYQTPHCDSGSLVIKYDPAVFRYGMCGGMFLGNTSKDFKVSQTEDSVIIEILDDSTKSYLDTNLTVRFSFVGATNITNYKKNFSFDLSVTSPLYSIPTEVTYDPADVAHRYPITSTNTFTKTISCDAIICPHNEADRKEVKHDATCCEYAHTDTVCNVCGEVLGTKYTGTTYAAHIYDYEDIVRTLDTDLFTSCASLNSYPRPVITTIVKCEVCAKNIVVMDLDYHKNLKTTTKKYDSSIGYYYECSSCKTKVKCHIQQADPATCVHTYQVTETVDATCQAEGKKTYTCSKCGNTNYEILPKLDHKFVDVAVTKEPTCTEAGHQKQECSFCGFIKEININPLGHEWGESFVRAAATCQTPGSATHTCTRCGVSEDYSLPIDSTAHKITSWTVTVKATCNTQGVETGTCAVCGETKTRTTSFGDHHYIEKVITPESCYEDGISEFTCEYCHDTKQETKKCSGHVFGPASSNGKNTTSQVCTKCGLTVSVTTTSSKTTKTVNCGPFSLTINNTEISQKDIDLRVSTIASDSEDYSKNGVYLNALSASLGKTYSIQDAYNVTLYVDGVETKFTSDMTLTLTLGETLKNAKTKVVYYVEQNSQTMIMNMDNASRKKLVVTIPGSALAMSANDTLILAIEGQKIDAGDPSTPPVNPPTPSTDGNIVVPIIIVVLAVLITGAVVVIVIKSGKKQSF